MNELYKKISNLGIIPVVKIEDSKDALNLGKALIKGGLPVAEITFRTNAAEESIKILTEKLPDLLLGAGTVLTVENVKKAVAAGAKFIVSPGFNPKIVDYCLENDIIVIPGVTNPSLIEQAIERGLEVVKFFPAEVSGGLKAIKAMAAAYNGIKFMPTGGINKSNITEYLNYDRILACGGSWMVKAEMIAAGEFEKIADLSREAVEIALGFEVLHIGINEINEKTADESASSFKDLFGFETKPGNSSIFAGSAIEIIKTPYLGKHGHIAIGTTKIEMAISYLGRKGFKVLKETEKRKNTRLMAVYLEKEISGFAIHLLQK